MCPDENALVAMIEQELDAARVLEIESHFDTCARCCEMISALAGTRQAALGTLPGDRRWVRHALGLPVDEPPPDRIGDRYRVKSLLGRGGMGAVYLAHDTQLGREVAIKLHRSGSGDERLQREAMAMAKLAHQNVLTVFEIGSVDDRLFVAMEYVRGGTLRDWMATRRGWRETLAMLAEIGTGLAAAHAAGLIHRDFKPENVLVGEDGRPRVGDFGLARISGEPEPAMHAFALGSGRAVVGSMATLAASPGVAAAGTPDAPSPTQTGTIVGTPAYMAPEQFAGKRLDARCDQFAFAVVAWECLYGARPFPGATAAAIQLAIEDRAFAKPTQPTAVPERVRRVLERGLAVEPADRFTDLPALARELQRAAVSPARKRMALAGGIAIVATAIALPVGFAVRDERREHACDVEAANVRAAFEPGKRAELERGFVATGAPVAATSFARTSAVIDRSLDALATEVAASCRGRDEPVVIAAARTACLADRQSRLVALIDVLGRPDRALVMRAPGAAWAMFDPKPCSDPRPIAGAASTSANVTAMATLRALGDTGRYADAVAMATPLVAASKQNGDRATELAALLQLGEAQAALDAVVDATATLHRAQALAETLGRDLEAAIALDRLANLAGVTQHDYKAAHRHLDLARAKLERLGDGNVIARGRLLATEAQVLMDEYRIAEAEPSIRRAVQLFEQAYGLDTPELGSAVGIASQVARGLGKHEEARTLSERTLKILDATLGSDHPTVAGARMNLASSLVEAGKLPEARSELLAADAIFARSLGEAHPARAAIAGNLADVEGKLGNHAAAIAALERAVAILESAEGPKAASTAAARRELAGAIAAAGRPDDALRELARSIAILEGLGADGVGRLRGALVDRAKLELDGGKPALAIASAERALAVATKNPDTVLPDELASTRFMLARALVSTDRTRALAMARAAASGAEAEQRAEIDAWLAKQPR
ncbi:MAG: serine/threonine-protein kinase [Kofleriaceae bacterium]